MSAIQSSVRATICICLWLLVTGSGCALFQTASPTGGQIRWAGRVDFDALDGRLAFRLEPSANGVRVKDGAGAVLLSLRLRDETLVIDNSLGKPIGVVVPPEQAGGRYRILSSDDRALLFELRLEPDGDLEIIDENGKVINEAKRRGYGFKVVDESGEMSSKIRISENKISLSDASSTTYLSTRDPMPAVSAAAIAFEGLKFQYAVAFAVAIAHWAQPAMIR